jgi:5-methylcytosine-specific restriction endonuclease McrA
MAFSSGKVLVLNADDTAYSVCSIYKAIVLVLLNKAEIVDKYQNRVLHTVDTVYPIPSVIRLQKYVHIPYKGVMLSRQNVFKRDHFTCLYCGAKHQLTLDHVLPKSKGGVSSWQNLVTACKACNAKKGNRTPEQAKMPLPYKPYKPSFVMFLRNFSGVVDESWHQYLQLS